MSNDRPLALARRAALGGVLALAGAAAGALTLRTRVSHTNLRTATVTHARLISVEHAKLVAAAGGVIGSWPSALGQAKGSSGHLGTRVAHQSGEIDIRVGALDQVTRAGEPGRNGGKDVSLRH